MLYDLAVLGGGAAGMRAACAARNTGMAVAVFEKGSIGGSVINNGKLMVDSLIESAASRSRIHKGHADDCAVKLGQVSMTAEHNLKTAGVDIIPFSAKIDGKKGSKFIIRAGEETYESRRVLLAFGSIPAIPRLPTIDKAIEAGFVFTNSDILRRPFLPKSVTVYGADIKGLQLACYAKLAGSDVTVILRQNQIAPELDPEIANLLKLALQNMGISFIFEAKLMGIERDIIHYKIDEGLFRHESDGLLLGNIRWPATRGVGLKTIDVTTRNGAIITDLFGSTNILDVYAAGDCTFRTLTADGAHQEADACVRAMLGIRSRAKGWAATPFLMPRVGEAGSVGDTADSAADKKLRPVVSRLPLPYKYYDNGLIKLIGDRNSGRLLGAHIIGSEVRELISAFSSAITAGLRVDEIRLNEYSLSTEIAKETLNRLSAAL